MGGEGTIDYFPLGNALVVNQTAAVHEQIAELLAALQRTVDNKECDEDCTEAETPAKNWALGVMPYSDPGFYLPWAMVGMPRAPIPGTEPPHPPMAANGEMPFTLPVPSVPPMMPYCPSMPGMSPVMQCGATAASAQGAWTMRVVNDAGKSKLSICPSNDDVKLCCERMELKTDQCGSIDFHARNGQIAVTCNGFDALADRAVRNDNHSVTLQGHVRICGQSDKWAQFSPFMDDATVTWSDGKVRLQCTWPGSEKSSTLTPVSRIVNEEDEQKK
jgi:hypothetical protein